MTAGRKALTSATLALFAALLPLSGASAGGALESCVLGQDNCITVDAPEEVVKAVDGATGGATDVVNGVKNGTDDATGGWSDPVTDPVVDGITKTLDLTNTATGGEGKKGKKKHRNGGTAERGTGPSTVITERDAAVASYQRSIDALAARESRRVVDGEVNQAASFVPPEFPSLGERLAQAALEAAKAFTFPAILIGLVVGFVLVQNRIDHRDPKLAFAPVSADQEYLSFT